MKLGIIMVGILLCTNLFSQQQFIEQVKKIPMINAEVYKYASPPFEPGDPGDPSLIIRSVNANVFSITDGSVRAVFYIDSSKIIVIRATDSNFYAYSSFDTVYFSKGDQIKTGDLIGRSKRNEDNHLFEITIMIADSKGNYLNENKILELIKVSNSIPIAAVCDATVMP